jgi:hypothetical protein
MRAFPVPLVVFVVLSALADSVGIAAFAPAECPGARGLMKSQEVQFVFSGRQLGPGRPPSH